MFLNLNQTSINFYEKDIEHLDMKPYKTFFVPFNSTKLNLLITTIQLKIEHHQEIRKKAKEKVVASICGKITLLKEYINTQRVTNLTNLITQSEAPGPEVIVVDKFWTDLAVNSGLKGDTRDGVTPEKCTPRNKINIKSVATSPPRKYPIPNQDKNNVGLKKYQCLPPYVPPFPPGFK